MAGRYSRATRRLAESVARLCRHLSLKRVAEFFGLHWNTVKAIDKRYLTDKLGAVDLTGVRVIAMDEFAIQKGHRYATVIVDPTVKRVLWVGRGRGRNNINRDWDGVWHVSVGRMEEGWTAEIAIPMITMRFPSGERQEWGINFMRNIRRKNEQVFWAPIPKAYDLARVSLAGSLTDLRSLSRGLDLRLKPFVAGGGQRTLAEGTSRRQHGLHL